MRDPLNINELITVKPDYIGFIFYPPSKRYIKDITNGEALEFIPRDIIRTGVFVNERIDNIKLAANDYKLSAVQLHGDETPEFCEQFTGGNLSVIKAFHMDDLFNFVSLESYLHCTDYFLFDTKTEGYGGSGRKFKWQILDNYKYKKPFFLSGGIDLNDVETIKKIKHPALYALDINSKFEISPGIKDINKIKSFIQQLKYD